MKDSLLNKKKKKKTDELKTFAFMAYCKTRNGLWNGGLTGSESILWSHAKMTTSHTVQVGAFVCKFVLFPWGRGCHDSWNVKEVPELSFPVSA